MLCFIIYLSWRRMMQHYIGKVRTALKNNANESNTSNINSPYFLLSPSTHCPLYSGKLCDQKKLKDQIGENQINQSQPKIDITAKETSLPEKFSLRNAVPLAIVLFLVLLSCSQCRSDWWHLKKMPTSPFPPSLTCILDTHQTLTELCGPSQKCWSPQSAINYDLQRLLSELDKK